MYSDFRFTLLRDQYEGSIVQQEAGTYLKLTFCIVFVCHIDVHIQQFSIYTKLSKSMTFKKISFFYCCIWLVSHLRYFYRFYHSRATRTLSVCNEMHHFVFRYEYFTFQTQIHLHKQCIFDTNIIQSEYAFLFPFSIFTCSTW